MTQTLLAFGFGILFSTSLAQASPAVSSIKLVTADPARIVQSVQYSPTAGVSAEAALLRNPEAEPSLVVEHTYAGQTSVVVDTAKIILTVDGLAGTDSSLAVSPAGALLIRTQNANGRDRFERTLTALWRDGKYILAGFTYTGWDSLNPDAGASCDYNLLNGKGTRNGRSVTVKKRRFNVAIMEDTESFYTCNGW